MSDSYTKLFSSITESTIWSEAAGTRLVWITMLAKCNRHGEVFGSVPGVARLANVSLDECEAALNVLLSPDKWSRTPDNEGRRIEVIEGGWRILNHGKFDKLRSDIEAAEKRRESKREWDRKHRNNRPNAAHRTPEQPPTTPVAPPNQSVTPPDADITKKVLESVQGLQSAPVQARSPKPATAICKAIIEAGMPSALVNPSHPSLVALIEAGVTPDQFADTVRELTERRGEPPKFGYLLGTITGRLTDSTKAPRLPHGASLTPTTRPSKLLAGLKAIEEDKRGCEDEQPTRDGIAKARLPELAVDTTG